MEVNEELPDVKPRIADLSPFQTYTIQSRFYHQIRNLSRPPVLKLFSSVLLLFSASHNSEISTSTANNELVTHFHWNRYISWTTGATIKPILLWKVHSRVLISTPWLTLWNQIDKRLYIQINTAELSSLVHYVYLRFQIYNLKSQLLQSLLL